MGIGGYADYLTTTGMSGSDLAESVKSTASETGKTSTDAELLEAAKTFESYLWEQVIKEMKKTAELFKDDEEESGYASGMVDLFGDTVIQDIAQQITDASDGGNSLARTLYEQMKRNYGIE